MTSFIDHYKLALTNVQAGDMVPVPLFPIGEWKSAKYPSLPLTRDLADELVANFEAGILGTEPMLDSSGKHDTSSPAAAWFKRLYVAPTKDGGEMLFGDARLTDLGAEQLNSGAYKYDSVEIGSVVDNRTGDTTPNVFRSATLTNTPVLRMLPPVLEAVDSIAASEPIEVACSEVAPAIDPVAELCDKIDSLLSDLNDSLKGKAGISSIRSFMREVKAKASVHKLAEYEFTLAAWTAAYIDALPDNAFAYIEDGGSQDTDGKTTPRSLRHFPIRDASGKYDPEHVRNALSRLPQSTLPAVAKAKAAATIGAAAKACGIGDSMKGAEDMKKTIEFLQLAEDASDDTVLAEVTKLAERATAAEAKLAESESNARKAVVEAKLAELIDGGHIYPADKDEWVALAEEAPARFDSLTEKAKAHKVVDLGEHGDAGDHSDDLHGDDIGTQVAVKAAEIAKAEGIDLADATEKAIASIPDLAQRRHQELLLRINQAS